MSNNSNNNNDNSSDGNSGPAGNNGPAAKVPFERQMLLQRTNKVDNTSNSGANSTEMVQRTVSPMETSFQPAVALRHDLIDKAIGFLTHPKVQDTPLSRKRDFLREKKGMTEAEIDEAVRKAGVVDRPSAMSSYIPPSNSNGNGGGGGGGGGGQLVRQPRTREDGFGWATMFAGVVALASMAVAALYAYHNYAAGIEAAEKKKKKKKGAVTPSRRAATAQTGGKKKGSIANNHNSDDDDDDDDAARLPRKDKEELADGKDAINSIVSASFSEESAKLSTEIERLMALVEENNRTKFELMRSNASADEALKVS